VLRRILIVLALFAAAAATAARLAPADPATTAAGPSTVLPAQVVDFAPPSRTSTFAMTDYGRRTTAKDDRAGTTRWRVVDATGNCCENYVTTTPAGRLLDFGGTYINYSDDRGLTWKQVRPLTPLVNGEGTIAVAPNGDLIGVGWDPYSGDHLQAFKYEAFSGKWFYNELPVHQPFYDREWVAVVPGPFSVDGATVPYISFLKGGYPSKDVWLWSSDGLNYLEASSKFVDSTLNGTVERALATRADATFDWIQPNSNSGMTPLGGGGVLAAPDYPSDTWALLDGATLTWTGFRFPGGAQPEGAFQVDSTGRIHNLVPRDTAFEYRISTDGGATWRSIPVLLPPNLSVEQIDFRANKAAGVAAVAVHAQNGQTGNDQDLAYKIDIRTNQPFLQRQYVVGLGDAGSTAGVGNTIRMDFQTVTILPDGRLALSFLDSTTKSLSPTTGQERVSPSLAIELETTLG
jgi:hypothetical protein